MERTTIVAEKLGALSLQLDGVAERVRVQHGFGVGFMLVAIDDDGRATIRTPRSVRVESLPGVLRDLADRLEQESLER